jgi:hypothetical protein
MWEETCTYFIGKKVRGIFQFKNDGSIKSISNSIMIIFEDDSQLIITVNNIKEENKNVSNDGK